MSALTAFTLILSIRVVIFTSLNAKEQALLLLMNVAV